MVEAPRTLFHRLQVGFESVEDLTIKTYASLVQNFREGELIYV